jgi:hypothetical protein
MLHASHRPHARCELWLAPQLGSATDEEDDAGTRQEAKRTGRMKGGARASRDATMHEGNTQTRKLMQFSGVYRRGGEGGDAETITVVIIEGIQMQPLCSSRLVCVRRSGAQSVARVCSTALSLEPNITLEQQQQL